MKTIDFNLINNIKISTTTILLGDMTNKDNRNYLPSNFINAQDLNKLLVEGEDDLIMFSNDELVCTIYSIDLDKIFMFKLDKNDAVNLKIKEYLNIMKNKYNVNFNNVKIYLSPSLDFDECYLNKEEMDKINKSGYLFVTKGTDNKYTYDLKWHTYVILKEYGVNNEDINASNYQTNQYPNLFYSKSKQNAASKMATYVIR